MSEIKLQKIGVNRWQIERLPEMKVEAIVFAKEAILEQVKKDRSLEQLAQAASLPQLLSPVVAMPDIHQGFGLPIGGVMAADNLVSSGAVGMDINCGVRLLTSQLTYEPKVFSQEALRTLIHSIERGVPVGLGGRRKEMIKGLTLEAVVTNGAQALIEKGYGEKEDIESIEEKGKMAGTKMEALSQKALRRAEKQIGTLGSGNHFIEIQVLDEIFDQSLAKAWGLFKNQICVMIHTGSRALGHQTCLDYTNRFSQEESRYGIKAPVRNLASLPADSPTGSAYLAAMAGAVNFAFANRQYIAYEVRRAFHFFFKKKPEAQLRLLYDVAHNIAKWEDHQGKKVLVHRKGATRALPANHLQNPARYKNTGHPALVPGSMGTPSFVLVGLPGAKDTYFSVNHGAGRAMSRREAKRTIKQADFEKQMKNIVFNKPFHVIADEAPDAYKDISLVVETLVEAKIAKKVCRLKPLAVIKGN